MRLAAILFCAVLACTSFPGAGSTPVASDAIEFPAILDVCEATSLDEAAARGARLGWPAAPEDRSWRAAAERDGGGPVRLVGWRRGAGEADGLLSWWAVSGPGGYRTCTFTIAQPGLLEALRGRFGAPDTMDDGGGIAGAFWRRGGADISFTRVGRSTLLNLVRRG